MATERRAFVVGVRAGDLRRSLGPTAWAVLEELVAQSTGPAERCEVTATTRALAVELGLSKDTVAHALLRLHRAGIATVNQRRTAAGTFAAGTYLVAVPDCIVLDDHLDVVPLPAKSQRAARSNGSQLALSLDR